MKIFKFYYFATLLFLVSCFCAAILENARLNIPGLISDFVLFLMFTCLGIVLLSYFRATSIMKEAVWVRTMFMPFMATTWIWAIRVLLFQSLTLHLGSLFPRFLYLVINVANGPIIGLCALVCLLIGCFAVKSPKIIKDLRRQGWLIASLTLLAILVETESMPRLGGLGTLILDAAFLPATFMNYRLWKKGVTEDIWKEELNSIGQNEKEKLSPLN